MNFYINGSIVQFVTKWGGGNLEFQLVLHICCTILHHSGKRHMGSDGANILCHYH